MNKRFVKLMLPLSLMLALLTIFTVSGEAFAQKSSNDEKLDVLISFQSWPGQTELTNIRNNGGNIKKSYHIAPVVAASVPRGRLDTLLHSQGVVSVDEDTLVNTTGEVLPWGVARVDAEQAQSTNKGTGVKVAVLDTGIDLDHPDLAVAADVTFVPGTANGDDDNGHGTLIAGIIGALDNDIGVSGVAPEAAIYSVKVLNSNGSGPVSSILSGIEWAVDNGMQVINMSFGSYLELPVQEALNNAYNLGITVVAGAGNAGNASGDGNNVWAPARFSSVIAVGNIDNANNRYATSSTGYQLEVMAPGVDIYSTALGGGYGSITGTSASAAYVAGVATLMINAGIPGGEVRHRLDGSAIDLGTPGWDPQYGYGLINAVAAINFSEPPDKTPPTTGISFTGTLGGGGWYTTDVTLTLSATDNTGGSGVAQTKYSLDGGITWVEYTSPIILTMDGSDLVLARSWDNEGNGEMPAFTTIKIDKTPPEVTGTVTPATLSSEKKRGTMSGISYVAQARDPASMVNSIRIMLTDEYGVYNQTLDGVSGTVYIEAWSEAKDSDGRDYTFQFIAYDSAGNHATTTSTVTVIRGSTASGPSRLKK